MHVRLFKLIAKKFDVTARGNQARESFLQRSQFMYDQAEDIIPSITMTGGCVLKKRYCERFSIPGSTLYYRNKPGLFIKHKYSDNYFPVINMSRGGAKFLCNERLRAGQGIVIKMNIPGVDKQPEIFAEVRWVSKNPEQSYPYQTGVAFDPYGNGKNKNSNEILTFFKLLEQKKEAIS